MTAGVVTAASLTTRSMALPGGLSAHVTHGLPDQDINEGVVPADDEGRLVITVGLAGTSVYQSRERVAFAPASLTLTWARECAGRRLFSGRQAVHQVRIGLPATALATYAPTLAASLHAAATGVRRLGQSRVAGHVLALAKRLALEAGRADVLQTHHLALGIAAEALRSLAPGADAPAPRFTDAEIQALESAHAALTSDLAEPVSLAGVAWAAGMTPARLRMGLHWRFGKTPAALRLEARMQAAWQWLAAGERVSVTAYRVGYPHPANFSTAFSRHFGMAPRAVPRGAPLAR